jgi:monovalent cation/proton antiporter MnhG/PhaG subunit
MIPTLAYTIAATHHPLITGTLLGVAVVLCILSPLALVVMRDSYQRLQFSVPVTSLAAWLVVVAVWVENAPWQARIKAILVALILMIMNSILTHATARAIRIRKVVGHWEPTQDEKVPVIESKGVAGSPAYDAPGGLQPGDQQR